MVPRVARRACAIVQPEMGHKGVTEFMRIGLYAQAHHLKVIPHATIGIGLFLAASLHASSALSAVECHEYQHSIFEPNRRLLVGDMDCSQGLYTCRRARGWASNHPKRRWSCYENTNTKKTTTREVTSCRRQGCFFRRRAIGQVIEIALGCRRPHRIERALAQGKVLKFVSWQKDERGVGDWWGSVIKEFEATHPGVKIEWTKVERGAYADTMTTLFAGGKPPDIVHLASFEFQKFADNGWLEPLDGYIKDAKLDMKGWAGQDTCVFNKQTVCTMMLYFGNIFAYNEEIAEEGGLEVPKNYAEFLAAARKLTKDLNGDGIIDQFGTGHETKGGGGQYMSEMMNYTLDAGGRWTNDAGKVTIDTPQMVAGLSRWKTIVKDSLTPRDLAAGEVRQMFADGKIALKSDGPWLWPIIQKGKAKDQIKLVTVPFSPPMGGSSNVLGIASDIPRTTRSWSGTSSRSQPRTSSSRAMRRWAPRRRRARAPTSRLRPRRRRISTCWSRRPRPRPTPRSTASPRAWSSSSTSSPRWSWRNRSA
jgi:multiple sugar transport system substrate-binding protein